MAPEKDNPKMTRRRFLTLTGLAATSAGLGPLLAACGSPAQQPAAQAPASGSAPAKAVAPTQPPAAAGVIELKFAHHETATGPAGKAYQAYADAVNAKSGGKIHITVYPSETLAKAADAYSAVTNGTADLAWTPIAFLRGKFPLTEAFNLPVSGIATAVQGAKVATQWYKSNPIIQKEWSEVHPLATFCPAPMIVGTVKKPVRKLEDMAGLKMQVAGGPGPTDFLKAVGANPIAMAPPDIYESLSKGVLDAFMIDWQGILSNRLYELGKYVTTIGIYSGFTAIIMNMSKWNSLSPDLQKIMDDPGLTPSTAEYIGAAFDSGAPAAQDAFKKAGGEIINLAPDETARWQAAAKPVYDAWVASVKDKGFDGAKELANLQDLIKKTK